MHPLRSTAGETLLEVLIALVIIVIGAFGAVRLLSMATVNIQLTKERVIATNLAREGIEAVRSIRDTNWLRYAGERRACWNNFDPPTGGMTVIDCAVQNTADRLQHRQAYTASFDASTFKWMLTPVAGSPALNLADGASSSETTYRLVVDAATKLYNHNIVGTASPYYREIFIEYLDDTGTNLTTLPTPTNANVMRVTSKVAWIDRGTSHDVTLVTLLTDHLGRTDHN